MRLFFASFVGDPTDSPWPLMGKRVLQPARRWLALGEVAMKKHGTYGRDELLLFHRTVERAIKEVPAARLTPARTSRIVRNVMACAATGERDPVELKYAALNGFDIDTMRSAG